MRLVAVLLQLLLRSLGDLGVLLGLNQVLPCGALALVVCLALDLSPLLETSDDVLVLPSELVSETADSAELAAGLEAEHTEGLWDDHALLVVVWWWDTLEGLQALHGLSTTLGLVWDHATDGAPEHLGWGSEVPWSTAHGVVTSLLAEECGVLHCGRVRMVGLRIEMSIS